MATGVVTAVETVELYNKFKLRKTDHRFVVLHIIESEGLIKIERTVDKDTSISQEEEYNRFVATLPTDVGRYFWADLEVIGKSGAKKPAMFSVAWNPDGASTKSNILYSMSKKALHDKCRQGMTEVQANDLSDLNYAEMLERGSKS